MRNWALVNTTSILISRHPQLPNQTKISGKGRAMEGAQGSFWGPRWLCQGEGAPGVPSRHQPGLCSALSGLRAQHCSAVTQIF